MILFVPYKIMLLDEGDVGIFGFGHFVGRFLGFAGRCGFRFFGFVAPDFFGKNEAG